MFYNVYVDEVDIPLVDGGNSVITPKTGDAALRYLKAKVKLLTKQLDESNGSKRTMMEQIGQ